MIKKKLSFILFSILIFFCCGRKEEINLPSLIFNFWKTDQKLVANFWQAVSADKNFQKIFRQEKLNHYFPHQSYHCTLRADGVAHQALVVNGNQEYRLKIKIPAGAELKFSVFSALQSELKFSVFLATSSKKRMLFFQKAETGVSKLFAVDLSRFAGQNVELILKSSGRGLGGWINPCLLKRKENPRTVIVLVYDTLRRNNLPIYGYGRNTAPFLKELCKEAEKYDQAFSTTSWTLPAHVSLFSGLDLAGHGVIAPKNRIPPGLPLFAELMQKNGFISVALTGGGFVRDTYGFNRGFQLYSNRAGDIFQIESAGILWRHFKGYMQNFPGEDWFLFLHTYQQHAPYKAPAPYRTAFNSDYQLNLSGVSNYLRLPGELFKPLAEKERLELIDLYDASILYCDQELLQPLVQFLRQEGRWQETMLIILSDHGEEFYEHQGWEHGHTLYDELVRIPLIVRYPHVKNGGESNLQPISICSVWKLIYRHYRFQEDYWQKLLSQDNEEINLALPEIPTFSGLFGRFSFLRGNQRYIYNEIENLKREKFNPLPEFKREELFELIDFFSQCDLASTNSEKLPVFRQILEKYRLKLKQSRLKESEIDPETLRQLKALGYLND